MQNGTSNSQRSNLPDSTGRLNRKYSDTEKYCPICDSWLPHSEFYKRTNQPSGLDSYCKPCTRKYTLDKQRAYRNTRQGLKLAMLRSARGRAKKRGLLCTITINDFEIPTVCPVLGISLAFENRTQEDNSPSLDRIDNSKGYVSGNVMVISFRANKLKSDATAEELQLLSEYVNKPSLPKAEAG